MDHVVAQGKLHDRFYDICRLVSRGCKRWTMLWHKVGLMIDFMILVFLRAGAMRYGPCSMAQGMPYDRF